MVLTATCPICGSTPHQRSRVEGYPLLACKKCGLEFLAPQPDDEVLGQIYGQHYYDAWGIGNNEGAVRTLKLTTFSQRIASLRPELPAGSRVLDVGCATGYFLEAAKASGLDAYGVELSAFGAKISRQKAGAGHVYQGELEDARFADYPEGRFDAIFMSDLIEHVRAPSRTLAAAHERLRTGGLLIITTPWTESLSRRIFGRRWLHYKPEHLFYFASNNLRLLLEQHGFAVVRCEPAEKCLSLEYAAAQLAMGGPLSRLAAHILKRMPNVLLRRPLRIHIGEATVIAQRI